MLLNGQYKKLVENYKAQDGTKTFKAVVKLFNPTGIGTWYLTELNPETNVAFGLADVHEELGYIDLNELQNFKGQFGLGIEKINISKNKLWKSYKWKELHMIVNYVYQIRRI